MSLTDKEFEFLLSIKKKFSNESILALGPPPQKWTRELYSTDTKEFFQLDYLRGSIEISKFTLNNRYRTAIVLVRLDSRGIHNNPDEVGGQKFNGPHVHIYSEKFGDKVAYPISKINLLESFTMDEALVKLLEYINVTDIPSIQSTI
jgi:hypothetical protein